MSDSFTSESLALGALAFLREIPSTAIWHLARIAERRSLAADEMLFRTGEPRQLLGVVVSGGLSIEQQHEGKSVQIIALGPGEVVGEGILLDDGAHGSSGRAVRATELVAFPRDALMKLLKNQPAVHAALLARAGKVMNDRIRAANATLLGARMDAERVRADVARWLDAIATLAAKSGADTAISAARDALAAGRDPASLTAPRS